MDEVNFQWDEGNRQHIIYAYPERSNTQDEVESLFDDPAFLSAPDPKHSESEVRFNAIARSNQNRVLFVVYVIRDGYIRPISCRPASKQNRDRYGRASQPTKSAD